ncbi:MAG: long-chain-fatty-acid--CoA ligase [Anaerolineae bacterium]|jgi:long-chain acyl-CoA synthetase
MSGKFTLRELSRYPLGTFADIIYRNAILYPENEAFVCGPVRRTFWAFNQRVNRLIHGLQALGIQKGEVIGILSWNQLEYPEVFGAAMKGGFVLAHLNPRLQAQELNHVLNDAGPKVLFVGSDFVATIERVAAHIPKTESFVTFGDAQGRMAAYGELLEGQSEEEPARDIEEDDPLTIFYTSGTTGIPRGALYTHRQKMENTSMKALDIGVACGDRHLVVLPMFHIGGDSHIWPFFLMGGCNVLTPQRAFDLAGTLQLLVEEQITDIHIVPTQLIALLTLPDLDQYEFPCLKRIWYAASPMPVEVLKQGLAAFGPIFLQGYGQTESGPDVAVLSRANHCDSEASAEAQRVLASCGQPCIGVHVRIVNEAGRDVEAGEIGEIIVKSRRTMVGYWHKPEETREAIRDGWLHTGDLGSYDERGFIYIADRKTDMIITGGENVYPKEVENVLYRHPAVQEVAVIGIPDPYWVESVHALVVLKEKAQAREEDIIGFCREQIAHYKAPQSVEFVGSLPKNPQGKILKREVRKWYRQGVDDHDHR